MTIVHAFEQFKQGFWSGTGFGLGVGLSNIANNFRFGFSNPFMFNCGFGGFGFYPYSQCIFSPPSPFMTLNNWAFNQTFQNPNVLSPMPYQEMNITNTPININCGWDTFEYSTNTFNNQTFSWDNTVAWAPYTYTPWKTKSTESKNTGKLSDYNSEKGNKLANKALSRASGFNQQCAKYVSDALEEAGLSNGERGHAYQMSGILRNNNNFKEVIVSDVDWRNLPAGCILVYDKGVQGYSKEYGHVQITTGDGRAVSDGITNKIKKPSAIFIPV